MSSAYVILRIKKPLSDGTCPIAIRIVKDRKSSTLHIGYSVTPEQWDDEKKCVRKSHPNSARLNNLIQTRLAEANNTKLQLETEKPNVSVQAIKQKIKPAAAPTFFSQAQAYLDALKAVGNYNPYTADKPRIKHFREFLKGQDISFNDVTVGCLDNFVVWLRARRTVTKKGKVKKLAERSVMNHLSSIRSVFAYARRQGVISKNISPFGKDGVVIRFPDTQKEGLNEEEVERLENLQLSDPVHEHTRKLFLFSLYFAGVRGSDVLRMRWPDFRDGRQYYAMGKNKKGESLKIPPKAQEILDYYEQFRENEDDLVFPELKGVNLMDEFITKRTIAFKISAIDKILKLHVAPAAGIKKKLTMHIARHTFGKLAGNKIPIKTLQKLYRHSRLATTAEYQGHFDHDEADNALDAVINKPKFPPAAPAIVLLITAVHYMAA